MRALPEVAAATGFAELLWTIEFTSALACSQIEGQCRPRPLRPGETGNGTF